MCLPPSYPSLTKARTHSERDCPAIVSEVLNRRQGLRGAGSLRRTSYTRVRLLLFLLPLCLLFFASPMMLFMECRFLFLIKRRKNSVLFRNKSDDSTGLLSAKWLPVIAFVTVFLTEAGFWVQGETSLPDTHLSKWLTHVTALVAWRICRHELGPGVPNLTKSCGSLSMERGIS